MLQPLLPDPHLPVKHPQAEEPPPLRNLSRMGPLLGLLLGNKPLLQGEQTPEEPPLLPHAKLPLWCSLRPPDKPHLPLRLLSMRAHPAKEKRRPPLLFSRLPMTPIISFARESLLRSKSG